MTAAFFHEAADPVVTFCGNDAFAVIVHFLFTVPYILFQMGTPFIRQVQPFCRFAVALEKPDGKSALDMFRQIVKDGFLNMGQCMFHTSRKAMSRDRNGIRILCGGQRFFDRFCHSCFFERRDTCHLAAQFFFQLLQSVDSREASFQCSVAAAIFVGIPVANIPANTAVERTPAVSFITFFLIILLFSL